MKVIGVLNRPLANSYIVKIAGKAAIPATAEYYKNKIFDRNA